MSGSAPAELGYVPVAPDQDERPRPKSGQKERVAGEEFAKYMHERRKGPPPKTGIDPAVLTMALILVGRARQQYVKANGHEPVAVCAERMTWTVLDTIARATYGVAFDALIGKQWWPTAKPLREARRVVDGRLEPQTFTVAA